MRVMFKSILVFLATATVFNTYANQTKPEDLKKQDEGYMQTAIEIAKDNRQYPFAAVIVDNKTGKIIAQGLNAGKQNPTYHGEMVAINNCVKAHPDVNWSDVTLYTTAEPCSMCQSAIVWAGIPRVVYGTSMEFLRSHDWHQIAIKAEFVNSKSDFYHGTVTGGVLADKTDLLFSPRK